MPHSRWVPPRFRLPRALPPLLAMVLTVAGGCREDTEPTAPDTPAALATSPAQALSFRQVSAAAGTTCGVTTGNRAYCWGLNYRGELGDGTTTDHLRPVPVTGGLRFSQVSVGLDHSCGLTVDSLAYCWGGNSFGGLGDGTTTDHPKPEPEAAGLRFRQLSAGTLHTCGITTANEVFCWGTSTGAGRFDELGENQRVFPFQLGAGLHFRDVSAGFSTVLGQFTCAITLDNVPYCWGENDFAQLGLGSNGGLFPRPVPVTGGHRFRQVSGGATRTCAPNINRLAFCWGANWYGGVGDGTIIQRTAPVRVARGLAFLDLADGGEYHACGIALDGRAYCWGLNGNGQLGDGTATNRLKPVAVAGGLQFRQLSTGSGYTCGVTTDHVAYCWGRGGGQLGNGTTVGSLKPVAVAAP
jgi:alpha-tubulin suppressor-like RCC1 family protein